MMVKKEKNNTNFGKKLAIAPAIMVASLGLCLVCLVYLNRFGMNQDKVLGAGTASSKFGSESRIRKLTTGGAEKYTEDTEKDIAFWQKIVEENPTYRDGWIRLAVGYYEQGEIDRAIEALDKAKEIDPNNETIKSLNKIIQR